MLQEEVVMRRLIDHVTVFDVFGLEHVLVVAEQTARCQDRLLRQTANVEEAIKLNARRRCRCSVTDLR